MYLKVSFFCKITPFLLVATCLFSACGSSGENGAANRPQLIPSGPDHAFNVSGQMVADENVGSIELSKSGSRSSAPVIELGSNQQLRIRFDLLEFESRQLTIRFTHHNPDWSRSSVPVEFFMDGFYLLFLDNGEVNQHIRPYYRTYKYDFPNEEISFLRSGNYMLHIEDSDHGSLLFSLPFFIHENRGSVVSSAKTIRVPRQNRRTAHQLTSRYILPDEVSQPRFDLKFYYTQNQFWGRSVEANELDFSDPYQIRFETGSDHSFIADYEFIQLPLNNLMRSNPRIFDTNPTQVPPLVRIFDDAEGFTSGPPLHGRFGLPSHSSDAQYVNVQFQFAPQNDLPPESTIYLAGDFNNWAIRSQNQLILNPDTERWQTSVIMKQGIYNYKYVWMENNRLDDLAFDDLFSGNRQEYHAFVYMRDSQQFYYRLLQVNQFYGGE